MKAKPIGIESYLEATENYEGYCTACRDFTAFECEPDAREYTCPDCGQATVYGAEEAMIRGYLVPDKEDDFPDQ
jgi:predicted RNA-binding Zn-ribbon protein involved in translation (DUF1610 family)